MGKPEAYVENYLAKECKKHDFLYYKFGTNGLPDRLFVGNGHTIFIELKAPGEKPRPLQRKRGEHITARGGIVLFIDTREQVDDFIDFILKNPKPKEKEPQLKS